MSGTGQIVVVGAGPAGCAAAIAASEAGARVVLIDEQEAPGGWLRTSVAEIDGSQELFEGQRGIETAASANDILAASSVDYRPRSVVWGLFDNGSLGVVGPEGAYQLQPEAVILATGSTEIVWPFTGWTLPGVMTARASRSFMHLHFVLPGRRVAVIGAGTDADQMAIDLEIAGVGVVHRFETVDGLEAGGTDSVAWVAQGGDRVDVDAVILALGSLPDPELARQALADLHFSAADGCHVPLRNAHMMTTVDALYVAGDAGGLTTVSEAVAQGFVAGYAATGSEQLAGAIGALSDISNHRPPHMSVGDAALIPECVQVDREEQVTAKQVREAISNGAVSINDVKRRTRAGMGVSQGRDTEYVIVRMINAQIGIPLDELVPMTARPPARLVPLASLAQLAAVTE